MSRKETPNHRPPIRTTRDRIVETAARLFTSKGFHQTSIDEIAQEAGVAKGSVYYHFPGKDQLLVSVIEEGVKLIRETVEARLDEGGDELARLLIVLGTAYDVMIEYHELARFALVGGCEGVSSEAKKRIDEVREAFEADVTARVQKVAGNGVDAAFVASVLVGALEGAVRAAAKVPVHVRKARLARSGRAAGVGPLGRSARGMSPDQAKRTFLLMCEKALAPGGADSCQAEARRDNP